MYTNAQVIAVLTTIDARLAVLEARASTSAPAQAAPVSATASAPIAIPERGAKVARTMCARHPEHVKGYTANGLAAHRTWCDGVVA